MKKILVCLAVLSCVGFSFAEEESKNPPLNKEEIQQLKAATEGLKEVFGIEGEKPATKTEGKKTENKKTIADVADKAVDMAGKLVSQAAETIQKVAPDVWKIMIKQQYANALGNIVLPLLLIILVVAYNKVVAKKLGYAGKTQEEIKVLFDRMDSTDDQVGVFIFYDVVPVAGMLIVGIWTAIAVSASLKYIINPEFYAVRDMLLMLLGKN